MFWYLFLAHLIADYPLQTNRIVEAKKRWPGLTVHVVIHLVTMFIIVGAARWVIWPYLIALMIIHFGIDTSKNMISILRPKWVILPYLLDQAFHILSILFISNLIAQRLGSERLSSTSQWIIYAIGYLLVTYVWFITERVVTYGNKAYQSLVNKHAWSRMLGRAILCSGLLLGWNLSEGALLWSLGLLLQWPYSSGEYWRRMLLTDFSVTLSVVIFIQLALSWI